jgi:hypothetical protein
MAYCTNTDVKVYVGTTVSDADLTAMITDADRDILAYFTAQGITVNTDTAKSASILFTRASVAYRFYLTGEKPTSWSRGDYSQSGAADQLALSKELRTEAFRILNEYMEFKRIGTTDAQTSVTRSDAVMGDFKLDQSDNPVFFSEDA